MEKKKNTGLKRARSLGVWNTRRKIDRKDHGYVPDQLPDNQFQSSYSGTDKVEDNSGYTTCAEGVEKEPNEAGEAVPDDVGSSPLGGDYIETSDIDEVHGLEDTNDPLLVGAPLSLSSFSLHVEHKLSKDDVDNLLKRKWKYMWEIPAFGTSNSKWMGTGERPLEVGGDSSTYGLKLSLFKHWLDVYKASGGNDFHSSKQRSFYTLCNSYRDILHYNKKPFYCKGGLEDDSSIMDAYLMHSLNHVFRTRDLVKKNDAKVAKYRESEEEDVLIHHSFLDHGFTRPKPWAGSFLFGLGGRDHLTIICQVLILLPHRSIALRVVRRLLHLTPSVNKAAVEYIDRFTKEFGVASDSVENDTDFQNLKREKGREFAEREALFGANCDDKFVVGIKFTRKSTKLYSDFYSSDIIVASPLGLSDKLEQTVLDKEKDLDYLSSIEILVVDHTDVIAMQDWSHVDALIGHLNRLPSKQHGTDIMRIREWYLDGHAQFYRQTIVLSSYLNADINSLFQRHCLNFEGKLKLSCEYKGVLSKVIQPLRQVYEQFEVNSIVDAADARFEYFVKKVYPKMRDSVEGGFMLFISSYFDYSRVRKFMVSDKASFCSFTEYDDRKHGIPRVRQQFYDGRSKIMIYTERAHFYHRYKIRGVRNLVIYSLPERKEFYPEIVNMLDRSHNMSCTVLFSRLDLLQLERILGSAAAKRMLSSDKSTFVIC